MQETVFKKKNQVLVLILILSTFLIAATALALTRSIRASQGGVISLHRGAWFIVPPGSLEEDTAITAEMARDGDKINFIFGPSGTTFEPNAELRINWQALSELGIANGDKLREDLGNIILYSESGEEMDVDPEISKSGVVWRIPHFSIYYYRRR